LYSLTLTFKVENPNDFVSQNFVRRIELFLLSLVFSRENEFVETIDTNVLFEMETIQCCMEGWSSFIGLFGVRG
jgi:hypothetical protein